VPVSSTRSARPRHLDARHHAQRPAQAAGRATSATAALEVCHRAHARVEDRIRAEPKTLRYRLWHAAARLVRHARQVILRFDHDWPWAPALLAAFARLRALPWPARC
jgi:Transposase DDE domain group 1